MCNRQSVPHAAPQHYSVLTAERTTLDGIVRDRPRSVLPLSFALIELLHVVAARLGGSHDGQRSVVSAQYIHPPVHPPEHMTLTNNDDYRRL